MKRCLQDLSNRDSCHKGEMRSPEVRRRRVEMEKRRRDKINHYLNELADLVPTAVDKKGTAKLEKAEVLELTVDHVRNVINTKGEENEINLDESHVDPELERRRGFLACLQSISEFLVKNDGVLASGDKLIDDLNNFLSSQKSPACASDRSILGEKSYHPSVQQRYGCFNASHLPMTHENIFSKICMDFLRNNSYLPPADESKDAAFDSLSLWQDESQYRSPMASFYDHPDVTCDFVTNYGSFVSFLDGLY